MPHATCPDCGRWHKIDDSTHNLFGPDAYCMKCVRRSHREFSRDMVHRFGWKPCPCPECQPRRPANAQV
jgi:hypothetical protein